MTGDKINTYCVVETQSDCVLCGTMAPLGLCLPMYEGNVVPDDHPGEWAGMHVCPACYAIHRPDSGDASRGAVCGRVGR